MQEQEKAHAASGIEVSKLIVVAQGNAFDGLTLHGPFTDYEWAVDWADHRLRNEDWNTVEIQPLKNELSEPPDDDLPEGLSPWRGKPGEIEIQDAQGHTWVTLHAGANGDPIKWRNAITLAVFTALDINPREIAK